MRFLEFRLKNHFHKLKLWLSVTIISVAIPANIYFFKVNNRNTRKRGEIFSKLTIKTPGKRQDNFF